jgi:hypothetical protein
MGLYRVDGRDGWRYSWLDPDPRLSLATNDYLVDEAVDMLEGEKETHSFECDGKEFRVLRLTILKDDGIEDGLNISKEQGFEGRLTAGEYTGINGIPRRIVRADLDVERIGRVVVKMIIDQPKRIGLN